MSTTQSGRGELTGTVVEAIVMPEYNQPLLTEPQKFEHTVSAPLQITGDIVSNLALNGFSTLIVLDFFNTRTLKISALPISYRL